MASGIRLSQEEVAQYFKDHGCELLDQYKNARTKVKYRCQCGNTAEIVLYSFKAGNRCPKCGIKKISERFTYTHEQAAKKFKDIGCELLEEYKGAFTRTKFRCHCGREVESIPNNIWRRKQCGFCGLEARSGDGHYLWHKDRKAFNERHTFRQRSYKLVKMVLNVTGRTKNAKTAKLLGYDYKQLQEHIRNHPNWPKVKDKNWHVDHIFPIKAFLDYGISDLKIINALDNLRPLTAKANLKKNAKYDKKEFVKYLKSKGIDV